MNKTRSLLVRFGALTFVLATALAVMAPADSHAQITVDGTRDAAYGTPLAVQTCGTGFGAGAGGSSLANAYAINDGTHLYLFIGGNVEGNYNKFLIFIDSRNGGQNTLNFTSGPDGTSNLSNLKFDNSFDADYFIVFRWGGNSSNAFADLATLGASGSAVTSTSIISGGTFSQGVSWAAINTASNGPTSSGPGDSANVTTGMEFKIPLSLIGSPSSPVKVSAFITGGSDHFVSNQFLAGLPLGTSNLGLSAAGRDLTTYANDQFFTIAAPAVIDTDGDGIPDATDPDDDNDGLNDLVESNTGIFVDANNTGSNPLIADTDGDGMNDGAEVSAGRDPNKFNYAVITVAGAFQGWSPQPTPTNAPINVMTPVTPGSLNHELLWRFNTATNTEGKFATGSWSINWGASTNAGVASLGVDPNIKFNVTASGIWRFTFNTDTLAYTFTRAAAPETYAAWAAQYGLAAGSGAEDGDQDGLDNNAEFAANTDPVNADTDGDTLSDQAETSGQGTTATLGVAVPTSPISPDTDGDGLRDDWELTYFLDPTDDGSVVAYTNYIPADIGLTISANPNGGSSDPDNDLLTNLQEFSAGSSPLAAGTGLVANNSKITIPGAFNGWDAEGSAANTMVLTGNFTWKLLFYFAAPPSGGSFKFANGTAFDSPANKNWGAQIPSNGVAVLNGGDINGSAVFTATGYYAVNFNDFTLAYSLAPLAATDTDADGLPDEYEAFYGGQLPTPTTDLVPATDYNGDGKTTAQNYADGTNPVKDVVAPGLALAPGVDKVTWYAIGATIPDPSAADVVATDDITTSPAVTILSPLPDNSIDGFNTVIYQAEDGGGNITLFRRIVAVGNVAPAYYNLRYPAEMMVNNASSNNAYGEIFIDNATPGAGQATGVQAWVGVNTNNTDPSTWDSSAWTTAGYVGEEGNNDNYSGIISGAGRTPGTYYYATRFQLGTNSSNPNYFYGGITTNGVGNAWGSVTNTNNEVTTYGNGVLTVQAVRQVTFAVNMNVQTNKSFFDPATQGVEVRGSFGAWAGGSALTNSNNSGIYTGTFLVAGDSGVTNQFKFVRTGPGTNAPVFEPLGNDRMFISAASDQTIETVFFNNDDGIGPVITLNGVSPMNLTVGDTYTEPGATATDAIDGSVTVTPSGTVDTSTAGTYTVTYNAVDAAGNAAIAITRTVIVAAAANPYDSWTSQNNLTGANALPTADPDKDGFTNRQEYAFGGNPNGSDAGLVQASRSGASMVLTWLQRTDSAAGYNVRSTTNLSAGFADNATLTGQAEDATSQAGVPQGYVRRQLTVAITGERNFLALAFDL